MFWNTLWQRLKGRRKDKISPKIVDINSGKYGHVDIIDENGITGWFVNLDNSEDNELSVYINDQFVGKLNPAYYRSDINQIFRKTLEAGFWVSWDQLNISENLLQKKEWYVEVKYKDTPITGKSKIEENCLHVIKSKISNSRFESRRIIKLNKESVREEKLNLYKNILSAESEYTGFFDNVEGLTVFGWAFNKADPEERVEVVVLVDGEPVVEGMADKFRQDLLDAGIGDGKHAFEITIPEEYADGKEHEINIIVKKTGKDLINHFKVMPSLLFINNLNIFYKFHFAIDECIYFKNKGFVFTGWFYSLTNDKDFPEIFIKINDIHSKIDKTYLYGLKRPDVYESFKKIYPTISYYTGYVLFFPFKESIDFYKTNISFMTKIDNKLYEIKLNKEIIESSGEPYKVLYELYKLLYRIVRKQDLKLFFDLIREFLNENNISLSKTTVVNLNHEIFGDIPQKPEVSIIIPLYGRYDFLRHQIAHFSEDRDFYEGKIEIIYVLDDPKIIDETRELARSTYNIFKVPFKLIWYNRNLGFAGANNVGVGMANGKYIILMNSDIIPEETGWVSKLVEAIETLPDAGIVAPTLLYFNGSIQHIGMYSDFSGDIPGLLLNCHYYKGYFLEFEKLPEYLEVPMATGALIIIKKELYKAVNGFDENFIFGDFEDSDLCARIIEKGFKIYVLPRIKLYHLERQSQKLIHSSPNFRQFVTLYNSTLYTKRIIEKGLTEKIRRKQIL